MTAEKEIQDFVRRGREAQAAVDEEMMSHGQPAGTDPILAQKLNVIVALDSALDVVVETKRWIAKNPDALTDADRLNLSTALKGMGRICLTLAVMVEGGPK